MLLQYGQNKSLTYIVSVCKRPCLLLQGLSFPRGNSFEKYVLRWILWMYMNSMSGSIIQNTLSVFNQMSGLNKIVLIWQNKYYVCVAICSTGKRNEFPNPFMCILVHFVPWVSFPSIMMGWYFRTIMVPRKLYLYSILIKCTV